MRADRHDSFEFCTPTALVYHSASRRLFVQRGRQAIKDISNNVHRRACRIELDGDPHTCVTRETKKMVGGNARTFRRMAISGHDPRDEPGRQTTSFLRRDNDSARIGALTALTAYRISTRRQWRYLPSLILAALTWLWASRTFHRPTTKNIFR